MIYIYIYRKRRFKNANVLHFAARRVVKIPGTHVVFPDAAAAASASRHCSEFFVLLYGHAREFLKFNFEGAD